MSDPLPPVLNAVAGDIGFGLTRLIFWAKRHATPYHLTVAAVLGAITVGFAVLVTVLIIIALNINVLGLIE